MFLNFIYSPKSTTLAFVLFFVMLGGRSLIPAAYSGVFYPAAIAFIGFVIIMRIGRLVTQGPGAIQPQKSAEYQKLERAIAERRQQIAAKKPR